MKFLKSCSNMFQLVNTHFDVFQTCSKRVPGTQSTSHHSPIKRRGLQEHKTTTLLPAGTWLEHALKRSDLQERLEHVPSRSRSTIYTIDDKDFS